MSDEAAFLAAIRAEPDDDVPRLAYADWLEERGDARGEFARLQCEAARLPHDHPRAAECRERAEALLPVVAGLWASRLPTEPGVSGHIERGLPECLLLSVAWLGELDGRDDFLSAAAGVRQLWLSRPLPATAAEVRNVCRRECLRAARGLALSGVFGIYSDRLSFLREYQLQEDVRDAFTSVRWDALTWLDWAGNDVRDWDGTPFPALRHLDLGGNPLAEGRTFTAPRRTLESLRLAGCRLSVASPPVRWLTAARPGATAALRRLDLSDNPKLLTCDAWWFAEFGRTGPHLLTDLDLSGTGVALNATAALARLPCLAHLTRLSLDRNSLGDSAAEELATSPHLSKLEILNSPATPSATPARPP